MNQNQDIRKSQIDPVRHYLYSGGFERRNPSELFNTGYYFDTNPDVVDKGINPLIHYLKYGESEGRKPLPDNCVSEDEKDELSLGSDNSENNDSNIVAIDDNLKQEKENLVNSGLFNDVYYTDYYKDIAKERIDPVLHYLRFGKNEGRNAASITYNEISNQLHLNEFLNKGFIPGKGSNKKSKPNILVCAHVVGKILAGAENSFIDLLVTFKAVDFNLVACLPGYNEIYVNTILPYVTRIYLVNYKLLSETGESPIITRKIEKIIKTEKISLVYVNTIMIREPLTAARAMGVPGITHVRELIAGDEYLAKEINQPKDVIRSETIKHSDYIIANSKIVADYFSKKKRTFVVPNSINPDKYDITNDTNPSEKIRVAMISSNVPKKGIYDFLEVARICLQQSGEIEFLLIGPKNKYIDEIHGHSKEGHLPGNLVFVDYVTQPHQAVAKANIIVNFSWFSESFGRTVLEGMAAGRPVVAYDFGAVSALIENGKSGYLVPHRDVEAAASKILKLAKNPGIIKRMGDAGREIANKNYSDRYYNQQLKAVIDNILKDWKKTRKEKQHGSGNDLKEDLKSIVIGVSQVSVIIPNYNYADFIEERLSSIITQTLSPMEIIFLDDASSDNSLTVAEEILSQGNIPYKIIKNETNQGTYKQWLKGISEARGNLVWIAEADDSSHPEFLYYLQNRLLNDKSVMAYSQSARLNGAGQLMAPHNLFHTNDLDTKRWLNDYTELGLREVVDYLFYRNSIPNVSACLFKKSILQDVPDDLLSYKYIGDWFLYCNILGRGKVSYISGSLNLFRRHEQTLTNIKGKTPEYLKELVNLKEYIAGEFPVHPFQIDRMIEFLNKDFKIEGVSVNADVKDIKQGIESIRENVSGRKRLVFLTTNEASHWGGSEQLWIQTARRCRELGNDVMVINKKWKPDPYFISDFTEKGIKVLFKEDLNFNEVVRFKPDLFIISTGDQDEGTGWYSKCRSNNISYAIINQLTKEPRYWPVKSNTTESVKSGYDRAARVFFTSYNNHGVMEKRLGCKIENYSIFYQPYFVDRDIYVPFPSMKDGIKLAIPAKLLTIHKGQDLALEVLNLEKWRKRPVYLNLYGIGADREKLKNLAEKYQLENVHFHMPKWELPNPDLVSIWKENHALLLPSYMEGMPLVVLNAMMCARVPVVTDIGGHREIIEDNITGFIAAKPTVEDLDEALERAYKQVTDWKEIGQKARQSILKYLPEDPIGDFVNQLMKIA